MKTDGQSQAAHFDVLSEMEARRHRLVVLLMLMLTLMPTTLERGRESPVSM